MATNNQYYLEQILAAMRELQSFLAEEFERARQNSDPKHDRNVLICGATQEDDCLCVVAKSLESEFYGNDEHVDAILDCEVEGFKEKTEDLSSPIHQVCAESIHDKVISASKNEFSSLSSTNNIVIGAIDAYKKEFPVASKMFDESPERDKYIPVLNLKPPDNYDTQVDTSMFGLSIICNEGVEFIKDSNKVYKACQLNFEVYRSNMIFYHGPIKYGGDNFLYLDYVNELEIIHYNNQRGEGKVFSFDLLGFDGREICVTCFNAVANQFYRQTEVGKVRTKQMVGPEVKRTSKRKTGAMKKKSKKHGKMQSTRKLITKELEYHDVMRGNTAVSESFGFNFDHGGMTKARETRECNSNVQRTILVMQAITGDFIDLKFGTARCASVMAKQLGTAGQGPLDFICTIMIFGKTRERGAAITKARELPSALSATSAACEHIHDWVLETRVGTWVSMEAYSDGSYNVLAGLSYSFQVTYANGEWKIVQGLSIDELSRKKLDLTVEFFPSANDFGTKKIVDSVVSHNSFLTDRFIEHNVVGIRFWTNFNVCLKNTLMFGAGYHEMAGYYIKDGYGFMVIECITGGTIFYSLYLVPHRNLFYQFKLITEICCEKLGMGKFGEQVTTITMFDPQLKITIFLLGLQFGGKGPPNFSVSGKQVFVTHKNPFFGCNFYILNLLIDFYSGVGPDENAKVQVHTVYEIDVMRVCPNHRVITYTEDAQGDKLFPVYIFGNEASTMLLKEAAGFGLCLAEIGEMMSMVFLGGVAGIVIPILVVGAIVAFFLMNRRSKGSSTDIEKVDSQPFTSFASQKVQKVKSTETSSTTKTKLFETSVSLNLRPPSVDCHKSFDEDDVSVKPIVAKKVNTAPINAISYSLADLQMATNSFIVADLIGEGSTGNIYQAQFDDSRVLAVTKINSSAFPSHLSKDFMNMGFAISWLRHPKVTELMGYCSKHGHHLLVYEFHTNGSLQDFLHLSDEYSKPLT